MDSIPPRVVMRLSGQFSQIFVMKASIVDYQYEPFTMTYFSIIPFNEFLKLLIYKLVVGKPNVSVNMTNLTSSIDEYKTRSSSFSITSNYSCCYTFLVLDLYWKFHHIEDVLSPYNILPLNSDSPDRSLIRENSIA